MTGRRALSLALLAFLLLAPDRAPSQGKRPDEGATEKRKPTTVELLEAGKGKKRSLRYRVKNGTQETLALTLRMDSFQEIGGRRMPSRKLVQKMTLGVEVTDVAANGDISYEFKLKKAEVVEEESLPPSVRQQLRQVLSRLEELSGNAVVSSRGITQKAHMDIPEGLPAFARPLVDEISQLFGKLATPLPEKPVAPGARWMVIRERRKAGIHFGQMEWYELVSVHGSEAEIRFRIQQKADPQELQPSDARPGAIVKLRSYHSTGRGRMKRDFENVVPEKVHIEMENTVAFEVDTGAGKREIKQSTKMRNDWEFKPPEE